MINLLPTHDKRQIRASKANVLLLRYCITSLILAVPLFLLAGGAYLMMNHSKENAMANIEESQASSAKYQHIQTKAQDFTKNLATAKSILDNEVKYSRIPVILAQVLPSGISLESLHLSAPSFGTPMLLTATGSSYDDAIRLKKAFENSDLFSDAHLQEVRRDGDSVTISISVIIDPEIINS